MASNEGAPLADAHGGDSMPPNYLEKWEERAEDLAFNDTVTKLTEDAQGTVALLLGLALACAVGAIYLGALAAQGSPGTLWSDANAVRLKYKVRARTAANQLRWSRWLILGAVLFLALGVYQIWFGEKKPDLPTAAQSVLVVRRSGSVACGVLQADGSGSLSLKPKKQGNTSTPLNDVVTLNSVAKCP